MSSKKHLEDAIARWGAWYDEDPTKAEWPDADEYETIEHYIVRQDVPELLKMAAEVKLIEDTIDSSEDVLRKIVRNSDGNS